MLSYIKTVPYTPEEGLLYLLLLSVPSIFLAFLILKSVSKDFKRAKQRFKKALYPEERRYY